MYIELLQFYVQDLLTYSAVIDFIYGHVSVFHICDYVTDCS